MSNAPNYTPSVGFATEETNAAAGRSTLRTVAVDNELANIESSVNAINDNIKLLQRDDGKIKDKLIEPFMLSDAVALSFRTGGNPRGDWQTLTAYSPGDIVTHLGLTYMCQTAHTSGASFDGTKFQSLNNDGSSALSAQSAAASALLASQSAQSAASVFGVSAWVSGTTYSVGVFVTSPLTMLLYRRISTGAGAIDPSLDPTNWLSVKDTVNVKDYGAIGDGITDDSAALTAAWNAIKATITAFASDPYVTLSFVIPPGKYLISSPVDWTGAAGMNICVQAYGAVLIGKTAGGNVVDMTGTLGAHVKGLTITGDQVSTPRTGLLIGPVSTATCGINSFTDCKFMGYFSVASAWNHGSETTEWNGCRFANSFPAAETYAYMADGLNRFNATSPFKTIRAVGTAVSFTANSFKHCSFRNWATGSLGGSIFLEAANSWYFDKSCYFLAFKGANFRIRNDASFRTVGLTIGGLFETSQAPGLDYCVEFLVSNGVTTGSFDNNFDFTIPLAKSAVIKLTEPGGGATTGTIALTGTIKISSTSIGAVKLFDAPTMSFIGDINCRTANSLNLNFISKIAGILYVDNKSSLIVPASTDAHNLIVLDSTSGNVSFQTEKAVFHCMNNSDTSGGIVFARSIGQADRNSEIEAFNSATQAANYLRMNVHNGTVGTKYKALSAFGDGRVEIGDSSVSNVLRVEPSVPGTGDVNLRAFGAGANISLRLSPKGTSGVVFTLANVPNFTSDANAAAGGVPLGGIYRNGTALQIRTV